MITALRASVLLCCAAVMLPAAQAAQSVKARPAKAASKFVLPAVGRLPSQASNFSDELRKDIEAERWDEAVPQLERLAGDGLPEAKGAYAMALLRGLGGTKPDIKRARAMLEDAASKGDLSAQRNIAQMLFIGAFDNGVPNYPGAWPYVEKLTEARDPVGMYIASKYFTEGLLGVRNPPVGLSLLSDAAVGGARNAQYDMALLNRRGLGDPPVPNLGMAAFWFAHAASNFHPLAMYEFGMANLLGLGVKQDAVRGIEWLSRAADTGNSSAIVALGVTYMTGQGVAKDDAKAKGYFEKAAAGMNGTAFLMLAKLQYDKAQTPAQKSETLFLLSQAEVLGARQGADMAAKLRTDLTEDMQTMVQKRIVEWRTANKISSVPRMSQSVE
jgi:TPR repeat protein